MKLKLGTLAATGIAAAMTVAVALPAQAVTELIQRLESG